jgi:hypothetical protein
MSKHTRGPWTLRIVNNLDHIRYVPIKRTVAGDIDLLKTEAHGTTDQAEANARLMIAAPDLLTALARLFADWRLSADLDGIAEIESVIAKARGE